MPERTPRRPPAKPTRTVLAPGEDGTRLHLKLAEGTGARRRNGRFVSASGAAMSSVEDVLRAAGIGPSRIDRLFSRAESDLDAERQIAEGRRGRQLADLNLYYEIAVPAGVSVEALCDTLNALPSVELAAPAPRPSHRPRISCRQRRTIRVSRDTGSARPKASAPRKWPPSPVRMAPESRSSTSSTTGSSTTKTWSWMPLRTSTRLPSTIPTRPTTATMAPRFSRFSGVAPTPTA